jgi:hypothetical protein
MDLKSTMEDAIKYYGVYKVMQMLSGVINERVLDYNDNPEAVIHKDKVTIEQTVEALKHNHIVRRLAIA